MSRIPEETLNLPCELRDANTQEWTLWFSASTLEKLLTVMELHLSWFLKTRARPPPRPVTGVTRGQLKHSQFERHSSLQQQQPATKIMSKRKKSTLKEVINSFKIKVLLVSGLTLNKAGLPIRDLVLVGFNFGYLRFRWSTLFVFFWQHNTACPHRRASESESLLR